MSAEGHLASEGFRQGGEASAERRAPRSPRQILESRYALLATTCAAVVLFLLVFQLGLGGVANRLGLLPRPQRLTELYFADPARLSGLSNERPLRFTFVIENREGATRTYRWSVEGREGGTTLPLAGGVVKVVASRAWRQKVDIPVAYLQGVTLVRVRLKSPAESIGVHLTGTVARRRPPSSHVRRILRE